MKFAKINLQHDDVELVVFGDVHIGSKECNYTKLKEKIKYVSERSNRYAIILGDIINNSTRNSVGDVYEEPLSPMEQMQKAVELFTPIKDRIIAGCSGNHERRSYRSDGIDLSYFLAAQLGYDDRYDSTAVCIKVSYSPRADGKCSGCKYIYLTHGDGNSGRTVGGKANGLQRRGNIIDADIFITGHTHQPIIFTDAYYQIDKKHDKIDLKERLYVNIGSFLDYEDYAELLGMPPSSTNTPHIVLTTSVEGDKKCKAPKAYATMM